MLRWAGRVMTSKSNLQWSCSWIRSPFGSVSNLLSSMTEFMFSTQSASTSPSNTMYRASRCAHSARVSGASGSTEDGGPVRS